MFSSHSFDSRTKRSKKKKKNKKSNAQRAQYAEPVQQQAERAVESFAVAKAVYDSSVPLAQGLVEEEVTSDNKLFAKPVAVRDCSSQTNPIHEMLIDLDEEFAFSALCAEPVDFELLAHVRDQSIQSLIQQLNRMRLNADANQSNDHELDKSRRMNSVSSLSGENYIRNFDEYNIASPIILESPLHAAVRAGDTKEILTVLQHSHLSCLIVRNSENENPLQLANRLGYNFHPILNLIENHLRKIQRQRAENAAHQEVLDMFSPPPKVVRSPEPVVANSRLQENSVFTRRKMTGSTADSSNNALLESNSAADTSSTRKRNR